MNKPKVPLVIPVSLKLTEDLYNKVTKEAEREGRTISNFIRNRVEKSLDDELLKSIKDESRI